VIDFERFLQAYKLTDSIPIQNKGKVVLMLQEWKLPAWGCLCKFVSLSGKRLKKCFSIMGSQTKISDKNPGSVSDLLTCKFERSWLTE
jgi:hypothetical protein